VLAGALALIVPASQAWSDVSQVASSCSGSSDSTLFPNNHRLTASQSGRLLGVYDPHGSGVQFVWRDPAGAWQTSTTGAVTNGFFPGDIANDRPASIAVARDTAGQEHAWVVWGGYTFSKVSAVKMRRLSNLDAAGGPSVGPEVTLEPAGLGNNRVDLAFLTTGLTSEGAVSWTRKAGSSAYEIVVGWLSSLDTDTPTLVNRAVLYAGSSGDASGTLVPASTGMRLVAARASKIRLYQNDALNPLLWTKSEVGPASSSTAKPSAVELSSGEILTAAETDTSAHKVSVIKFEASGASATTSLATTSGYSQPSIATDGSRAWVFMVRNSDKSLVSRELGLTGGWGDYVSELPSGDYAWPNTIRSATTTLRLFVDGPRCPSSTGKNAVLYYERVAT
jgi:hypothetical protein